MNHANISAAILSKIASGLSISAAIDAVLGEGAFIKLAGDVYDSLRSAQ